MSDRQVIVCNLVVGTKVAAPGARAYVMQTNPGGGHDRIVVLVRSRGGRFVDKWEDMRRLARFRFKTLPPAHPMYDRVPGHFTDADLQRLVAAQARVRPRP